MGFYDSPDNVEKYVAMAAGYDGDALIDKMRRYLASGCSVLEIGMGPGVDLDLLSESFDAIGSDTSNVFLRRYLNTHPGASVLKIDAVTLETDQRFDAVYSNKVLHHLGPTELAQSFRRQTAILNPGGYAFHSFWYGEEVQEFEGLMFHQHTESSIRSLVETYFEVLELYRYTEMDQDDSLFAILKLQ